jgi:hypothetical protein
MLTLTNLPNPSLINEPAKTADMISISFEDLCGEDDFRCLRLKRPGYRGEREGAIRSKRVDMLWRLSVYLFGNKFLVIAATSQVP